MEKLLEYLLGRGGKVTFEEIETALGISKEKVVEMIDSIVDPEIITFSCDDWVSIQKCADFFYSLDLFEGSSMEHRFDIRHYIELDSTNETAKRMAEDGADEWTIVVSDSQKKGRGRFGRVWESPPFVNIYLSVILRPPSPPPLPLTLIPIIAGISVREALFKIGLPCDIRWPNDIIYEMKKVAGILVESGEDCDHRHWSVIGVGINVNSDKEDFSEETREIANSLFMIKGEKVERRLLFRILKECLISWYQVYLQGGIGKIIDVWNHTSGMIGKRVMAKVRNEEVRGMVRGLREDGALLVMDETGRLKGITSGEVEILRMED